MSPANVKPMIETGSFLFPRLRPAAAAMLFLVVILLSNSGVVFWVLYFFSGATFLDALRFFLVAPFCLGLAEYADQWGLYVCLWCVLILPAFLMRTEIGRVVGCLWLFLLIPLNIVTTCVVISGGPLDVLPPALIP
jgi:hypothetical protein